MLRRLRACTRVHFLLTVHFLLSAELYLPDLSKLLLSCLNNDWRVKANFFFFYRQFIILSGRFERGTSNERTNLIPLTDSDCEVAHRQLLSDYPNWVDRKERLLSDPEVFLIAAARGHESPDLYPPLRGHLPCRMDLMDAAGLTCNKSSAADGLMQKRKCSFAKHNIIV